MTRNTIIIAGRQSGKSAWAAKLLEKFMDENPKAVACVVRGDGTHEIIENAEFEDVTSQTEQK